jgi:hypothetical protein
VSARPENSTIWCWRCSAVEVRVRVFGVPCDACREILNREYDAAVAAKGGKPLHLPDGFAITQLRPVLSRNIAYVPFSHLPDGAP